MDNILKLLLGVLGLAGLLAMLTPSQGPALPLADQTAPPVAEAVIPENATEPENTFVYESDEEVVKFGEPMMDGKPILDPDGGVEGQSEFNQSSGNTNNNNNPDAPVSQSQPQGPSDAAPNYGQQVAPYGAPG